MLLAKGVVVEKDADERVVLTVTVTVAAGAQEGDVDGSVHASPSIKNLGVCA